MTKATKLAIIVLGLLLWGAAHAGTHHYYYTDPQGTVLAKTDAQGNIIATYEYTPYGVPVAGMSGSPDGVGYTGHVNDPETGLVYMQARYYDPMGRMLSVDPMGPTSGNVFSFNRYAYVNNNPIANIDPDGRQSTMDAGWWTGQAIMAQQSPQQVQQLNQQNAAQAQLVLGTLATAAASPAAGFVAKTAVAVVYDSLAAGSLAAGLMANGPAVVASGSLLAEGVAAANGVNAPMSPLSTMMDGEISLTTGQSSNLARFEKSLPSGNLGVDVDSLGGGVVFSATVPGRVPGSSAVYQKTVDNAGQTSSYLKTTFAPNGSVVHIKDKINNTIIPHDQ
ncbi:RHS repeat-associated core domain-containing protein [Rhodanobacter sp. IGA1.0]|uniref:RHS repeat-associated core domain-containing protein n=1 Tax=Rhodanobacter sp. IGA1.0 TaxID=3158582 RepID=A0AAU7QLG5_9GAMM